MNFKKNLKPEQIKAKVSKYMDTLDKKFYWHQMLVVIDDTSYDVKKDIHKFTGIELCVVPNNYSSSECIEICNLSTDTCNQTLFEICGDYYGRGDIKEMIIQMICERIEKNS